MDLLAQFYIKTCRLIGECVVVQDFGLDDSRNVYKMSDNEKLHYTAVYMLVSLFAYLDSAPDSDSIRIRAYKVQALVNKFLFY